MSWATAITAGATLATGYLGNRAADAQGDAAQAGLDFTRERYADAQGNFQPYLGAGQQGVQGLGALAGGEYGGFLQSPDYLASQQAGIYALDHSAAARNRLNSGGYAEDLMKASQNNAAQFLGQYRQSLQYLAGMGQQSAAQLGQIGGDAAQQVGQQYNQVGQAQAQGYGAWAGTAAGIAGQANNYLQGRPPTNSSYGGGYGTNAATPVAGDPWNRYGGPVG